MKVYIENSNPDLETGANNYFVARVSYLDKKGNESVAFYAIANDRRALDATIRLKEDRYFPGLLTLEGCKIEKRIMYLTEIELSEDLVALNSQKQPEKKIRNIVFDKKEDYELELVLCPILEVNSTDNFVKKRTLLSKDEIMTLENMDASEGDVLLLTENNRKPIWDLEEAIYNAVSGARFPEIESFIIDEPGLDINNNLKEIKS